MRRSYETSFMSIQTIKSMKHFFMNLPKQLKESPGLSDVGLQLFPQTYETDGFFLTRLKKIN